MVDNFSIAISHLLIALAAWRLVWRADLDKEAPPEKDKLGSGFFQPRRRPGTEERSDA
ncbi:hypothetical protein C7451_11635 [Blastomonas natatoria]|uniref:Uncharacterized protein n=1 Tax=Blastomonas natatoria TaxID=34015 RepID=A0A2V3UQU0_9SPHN|nr:hypothetical protein [Blastomonas natatoria]PXW69516.1 hypothetical protein C7451_11635 [Blastomonas natatoria]